MSRSLADTSLWMREGTALLVHTAALLDETAYDAPSALPGWSRKHVVAHVAANADALANLVHWAVTGTPTPMYASPEERAVGIEEGSRQPGARLTEWLRLSCDALEKAMDALDDDRWTARVLTAQGRTVPATEIPWLRSREVWVHAVDLGTGVRFGDLPADFLTALCDDVVARRGAAPGAGITLEPTDAPARWHLPPASDENGETITVTGPLAEITAYLAGRDHCVTTAPGAEAPALSAWL
ncbi:maleylpyruvate isomerase family mycothiol-dependent enzyme [Streptomyces cylindrosporus]|uniref:Maleylpyruvate isomerase family mycothiol-dependent enzyme n=1 Tax=Streptomyces cylindrosporus TaxID=2927583 RepID=A0ABS9Y8D5_9ACTN|nr:maleylpyruvate isomerase family mycothiol-dependent enzyme [Streptomyces cylindrosporus]MCI3273482.1 maleylpyruvate isomerase family mycothiol-dependent enzyme [Streptomyces cylindrosporus]